MKALLIVLDGFGIGKDSPFNAIKNAEMPFYKSLLKRYPHSQLLTHGPSVGLPEGVMGNSEVGHMTLGAGRIIYQDLSRISNSILNKSFFKNTTLLKAFQNGVSSGGRIHLIGLLSDGGVHSHQEHLFALLRLAVEMQIPEVYLHLFTDGRDTPPNSGIHFFETLLNQPEFLSKTTAIKIASVSGRYFAMDRDNRCERVEKAYDAMTGQIPTLSLSKSISTQSELLRDFFKQNYAAGKTDEFIEPTLLDPAGAIRENDSVLFFNYRSDRAREITLAFMDQNFSAFNRKVILKKLTWTTMTQYDRSYTNPIIFEPQNFNELFGEWLETKNKRQFRIAETEKYAHVTFFFNGGREAPFKGEDRLLIPSPKEVATYDLKPEMSAFEVSKQASARLESQAYDFMLMNFANADMVGHTGNYKAAIAAMEALDKCLAETVGAAERNGYHTIITADHGNAEEMVDADGHLHTQHTLNPVPAIWVAPGSANAPKTSRVPMRDGGLQDVMPTLCELMHLGTPESVSGKSLLPNNSEI